jgi:hypothetical protein
MRERFTVALDGEGRPITRAAARCLVPGRPLHHCGRFPVSGGEVWEVVNFPPTDVLVHPVPA